jgi:hypothetical protein
VEVYDINGNRLDKYDLSLGKLVPSTRVEHHEAVEPVEEVSRWEEKRHPNGGVSRRKIIEQQAVRGVDAWDEEITIYTYTPYTTEELEEIEREKNKPTAEQRLTELEEALALLISGGD